MPSGTALKVKRPVPSLEWSACMLGQPGPATSIHKLSHVGAGHGGVPAQAARRPSPDVQGCRPRGSPDPWKGCDGTMVQPLLTQAHWTRALPLPSPVLALAHSMSQPLCQFCPKERIVAC